ncbi:MAG: hypothetical protein Fur0037_01550 [Planctomycetota bacterium]
MTEPETPRRRRYRPAQKSAWRRIPLSVRLLLFAAAAIAGYLGYDWHRHRHAVLRVEAAPGAAEPVLALTFFPFGDMLASPSPMPPTGTAEVRAGGEIAVDAALCPGRALVRYAGAGTGTGYAVVELGTETLIRPAPPASVRGRAMVFRPGLGALSDPFEPLAGARILALGGSARGVPLAETSSDLDGWFTVEGIAADLGSVALRILDDGYAIDNLDMPIGLEDVELDRNVPKPFLVTVPTVPVRGRVILPDGVDPARLAVVARGLPGVDAPLAADGSFALDHVPPGVEPRLLVHGLPEDLTHAEVHASAKDEVRIAIVPATEIRGWVLDANTRQPIPGAEVFHEAGPMGLVGVTTDPNGAFRIGKVPAGIVRLSAQHRMQLPPGQGTLVRTGHRDLRVEAGVPLESIIVTIE